MAGTGGPESSWPPYGGAEALIFKRDLLLHRVGLRVDFLEGKAFGGDPVVGVGQHQPGQAGDARDPGRLLRWLL